MTPVQALEFVEKKMVAYFPLGDYKVSDGVAQVKL
jgi:hypothetical protein